MAPLNDWTPMPIVIKPKPVQLTAKAEPATAPAPAPAPSVKPKPKTIIIRGPKALQAPATPPATSAPATAPKAPPTASKALPKPLPKPLPRASVKLTVRPGGNPASTSTPNGLGRATPQPVEKPDPVAGMSQEQQAAALAAGLITHEDLRYEQVSIGTRVVISNDYFPWVKHYKPGDRGIVSKVSNVMKNDPLGLDDAGHHLFVILIDQPLDKSRMGQTAALFRKEFKVDKGTGVTLASLPSTKIMVE